MNADRGGKLRAYSLSLSALATVLTLLVFLAAISSNHSNLIVLSGGGVSAYLILTMRIWLSKSAARSGLVIIMMSAGVLLWTRHQPDVAVVLSRFIDVFWLLLGMGLLRHVMGTLHIPEQLSQQLIRREPGKLTFTIAIITAFLSWPMNLGVTPLIIDALKQSIVPTRYLAAIVMRMACITMVLVPTTIGAAAVFAAMPDTPLLTATVLGAPLFFFSLLLLRTLPVTALRESACHVKQPITIVSTSKTRLFLALFLLTFIVALTVIKLNALQSIALTAGILYGVERFSSRSADVLMPLTAAARSMSGEVVLLLGCSLLTTTCSLFIQLLPTTLNDTLVELADWQRYALILLALPFFGVAGIHPMLLFSVSYPVLAHYMTHGVTDYLVWICFFIATQLLSPVSINAVFAANSLHVSTLDTSFRMHIGYVLIFNIFALIYLSFIILFL